MAHEIDRHRPASLHRPPGAAAGDALGPYEVAYDVRRGYEAAAPFRRRRRREDDEERWEARREDR